MEDVTTDGLTGNVWRYSDGWYYQFAGETEVSKLSHKNFPDPNVVWDGKMATSRQNLGRELTADERDMLKPRAYVFDIWEHRLANAND